MAVLEDARVQSVVHYVTVSVQSRMREICQTNIQGVGSDIDRISLNPLINVRGLSHSVCKAEDSIRWAGIESGAKEHYCLHDMLSFESFFQDLSSAVLNIILTKQLFGRLVIRPHREFPSIRVIGMQFSMNARISRTSYNQEEYDILLFRFLNGDNLDEYEDSAVIPLSEFNDFIPEQTSDMHATFVCALTKLIHQLHQYTTCIIALSDLASEGTLTNYVTDDAVQPGTYSNNRSDNGIQRLRGTVVEATPLLFKRDKADTEAKPVPGAILLPKEISSVQRPSVSFAMPPLAGYVDTLSREIVAMISLTRPESTFPMVHHHDQDSKSLANGGRQQTMLDLFADSIVARLNSVCQWKSRQLMFMFNRTLVRCPPEVVQWVDANVRICSQRFFVGQIPRDIHLMVHSGSNSIEEYMTDINATVTVKRMETDCKKINSDIRLAETNAERTRDVEATRIQNDLKARSEQVEADRELGMAKLENDKVMLLEKLRCDVVLRRGLGDTIAETSEALTAYEARLNEILSTPRVKSSKKKKRESSDD